MSPHFFPCLHLLSHSGLPWSWTHGKGAHGHMRQELREPAEGTQPRSCSRILVQFMSMADLIIDFKTSLWEKQRDLNLDMLKKFSMKNEHKTHLPDPQYSRKPFKMFVSCNIHTIDKVSKANLKDNLQVTDIPHLITCLIITCSNFRVRHTVWS